MNIKDIKLSVEKAEGIKCNRCKKVVKEVKHFYYPNTDQALCLPCFNVVNNTLEDRQSGWYNNVWVNFFPHLNSYHGCANCDNKDEHRVQIALSEDRYSILHNLGKGQEYIDFCSISCVKQHIDKEKQ